MTDGAVGYEAEMLALIERRLGSRRFFTIGIGSAPNGWFMRKAAAAGRGSYTYVNRVEDVEARMAELYAKLGRPMLTGLQLRFDGAQPIDPVSLPGELYAGEPIVVRARFAGTPTAAVVSGNVGAIRWESRVEAAAAEGSGLHAAWARQRIEELGDEIARAGADRTELDALRARVRDLGLAHHLVTAYTSLVAVDVTPVRPADAPVQPAAVPTRLPAGWELDALRARVRDLGLAHHLVTAYTSLVAVDVTPVRPADAPVQPAAVPTRLPAGWELDAVFGQGELAQGATPAALHVATGILLLALASLPWLRSRLAASPARGAARGRAHARASAAFARNGARQ
jgi:hypothetical protein